MHYEKDMTQQEIADHFGQRPCRQTVSRLIRDHNAGRLPAQRGRKGVCNVNRKFNAEAAAELMDIVENNQQMYLHEIADEMELRTGMQWTMSHLSKCLDELDYVRVVIHKRSREATDEARAAFREVIDMYGIRKEHLVFGDEVSTVSNHLSCPQVMFATLIHDATIIYAALAPPPPCIESVP
jgi:arginine repressor